MTKSVQPDEGERHPYHLHIAKALDSLIRDLDIKATWLAHCLGVSECLLSDYRTGKRPIPYYRALLVDEILDSDRMAKVGGDISGFHLIPKTEASISAEELERLFPQILREEGAANADIVTALLDHTLDGQEQVTIHRHAAKLRHFWQQVEERTAAMPKLRREA